MNTELTNNVLTDNVDVVTNNNNDKVTDDNNTISIDMSNNIYIYIIHKDKPKMITFENLLYDEALFVAVHQHHHLAKATTVKIQQLIDEDFVSTPHAERGGLSYLVSNICLSAGFAPKKARIQSRKVSQLQLVAANIGICIVPAEFKNIVPEQVRLIALDIELVRSDVVMAWNSHADDAVVKCAKELVKCFQQ